MKQEFPIVAIDFDGTLAMWDVFPKIGREVPHAVGTVLRLQAEGCAIILWTVRSGESLAMAMDWCKQRNIMLYGANVRPYQSDYSASPKVHADLYIDDAALGCPLVRPKEGRPYVNWVTVSKLLKLQGLLP